ncbi:MAG: hypothetical protein HQL39_20685 [Alphaproteobacteria bacterium]|nr:hypothetical protein [Alphaproteobacteria bacterium]
MTSEPSTMISAGIAGPPHPPVSRAELFAVAALLVGILLARFHSYLLFHTLVELFGIGVVLTAFSLAWNTRRHLEDGFLRVAGLALGPITAVTTLHTLAYKGMGVFPDQGGNLPTQFWIGLRVLQATALFAATVPAIAALPAGRIVIASSAGAALVIAAIFGGVFPDCFVDGQGLTPFKVGMEYVVMAVLAAAAVRVWHDSSPREPKIKRLAIAALAVGSLESAAFTLYVDVYGAMNMVGHVLGLIHGMLVYTAVAWVGLAAPQEALYVQQGVLKDRYRKEADAANRDITRFTEVLAHHLQEPVRLQHVFSQRLLRSMPDQMPDDARQALTLIMEGAKHQRALLRDVQLYLSVAQVPRPAKPCRADKALDVAMKRLAPEIALAGLTVHRDPLPELIIDQALLVDLFAVLITNAIDYRRPGTAPALTISAASHHGMIEISLTDDGIGIAPEHHARVFQVFERLDPTPGDGHTGIGLALAKKIVESAGGDIWIETPPDGGTSLRFTLAQG